MMRNAWMEANRPLRIGMYAASPDGSGLKATFTSPDGSGFKATFTDFKVTHLPDKVRTDWLIRNSE